MTVHKAQKGHDCYTLQENNSEVFTYSTEHINQNTLITVENIDYEDPNLNNKWHSLKKNFTYELRIISFILYYTLQVRTYLFIREVKLMDDNRVDMVVW